MTGTYRMFAAPTIGGVRQPVEGFYHTADLEKGCADLVIECETCPRVKRLSPPDAMATYGARPLADIRDEITDKCRKPGCTVDVYSWPSWAGNTG